MEDHILTSHVNSYGALSTTHICDDHNVSDGDNESLNEVNHGDFEGHVGNTSLVLLEGGSATSVYSKKFLGASFNNLRSASLSISMLAKPSDDRRVNAALAGWNVSNLIQGTGILGVPYAVQQGGWAAVAMIFVIAILCCYTGKVLIGLMYETSKKTGIRRRLRVNYPEVGEACFGPKGYVLCHVLQSVEMFSATILYVVLLGTAWADLFRMYPQLGLKEWAAINVVIALPLLFITKMSIVSWLSMFSVFSLMSALLVLISFTLTQVPMWSINNIPAFNPQTFPIGFGIIVFSYTAHAVFPSIEGAMKKPTQFNSMMNYSFLLAAVVKACLGTFMVLRFGKNTGQVATVNLGGYPVFSRVSTALVISNVIFALPLVMFVVSQTFDDAFLRYFPLLNRDTKYHNVWLLITRPLLITLALFIAIMVPFFGLLMGVIGSFTGSCLCFLLPCIMHLKLRWSSLKRWEFLVDVTIIIFGIVAGITGMIFSMKSLIMAFRK